MDISTDSDDDFITPSGSVIISRSTTTITGCDGSTHIVPKVNKNAMRYLAKRKAEGTCAPPSKVT